MNAELAERKKRTRFFLGRLLSCLGGQFAFTMLFTALELPERREPFIPLVLTVLGISTVVFCLGLTLTVLFLPERKLKEAMRMPLPE